MLTKTIDLSKGKLTKLAEQVRECLSNLLPKLQNISKEVVASFLNIALNMIFYF
jgi:hypothetical protein